jgi:hypothetical protein
VRSGAVLEAPALVAGLDDVAVVRRSRSAVVIPAFAGTGLGIAEDVGPFAEGEVGRGPGLDPDDGGLLVELADQVEQQLAAGLGERRIAEFRRGR